MSMYIWGGHSPVSPVMGAADPWAALDGRAGAPAGTPQFPTLLNTYHDTGVADGRYSWPSLASKIPVNTGNIVQPPWKVPGVDYHVGIDRNLYPTNASLTAANAISQAGVTLDTTNHQAVIINSNVVLDGIDFSVSPGWSCNIGDGSHTPNNCTISNCNFFSSNTQAQCPINVYSGTGHTVINCEINENFVPDTIMTGSNVCCIQIGQGAAHNFTLKYCLLQNSWADGLDFETGSTIDIHYNVFKDFGNINAHPDLLQIQGTTYGPSSCTFNLSYWTAAGTYGPQGYYFTQDASIVLVGLTEVAYNTIISQATNPAAAMGAAVVMIDMARMSNSPPGANTARVHDNFCDPTGVQSNFAFADPGAGGNWNYPQGKSWNATNMLNGTIDSAGPPNFSGTGP